MRPTRSGSTCSPRGGQGRPKGAVIVSLGARPLEYATRRPPLTELEAILNGMETVRSQSFALFVKVYDLAKIDSSP